MGPDSIERLEPCFAGDHETSNFAVRIAAEAVHDHLVDGQRIGRRPGPHRVDPEQAVLEGEAALRDPEVDPAYERVEGGSLAGGRTLVEGVRPIAEAQEAVHPVDIERGLSAESLVSDQPGQLSPCEVSEQVQLRHSVARHEISLGEHGVVLIRGRDPPQTVRLPRHRDLLAQTGERDRVAIVERRDVGRQRVAEQPQGTAARAEDGAEEHAGEPQRRAAPRFAGAVTGASAPALDEKLRRVLRTHLVLPVGRVGGRPEDSPVRMRSARAPDVAPSR